MSEAKKRPSPFVYSSHTEFLRAVRLEYGARQKPVPLLQWARRLGYKTARSLELILSGDRLPSEDMIFLIAKDLGLNEKEREYFSLMVLREKYLRKKKPVHEIEKQMDLLRPARFEGQYIDNEIFRRVSEWYPLVIRQLAMSKEFQKDLRWITKKLRNKVTSSQAMAALAEWEGLAFDRRSLYTAEDVPSQAVRVFHKKMLQKAIEAADEVPVEEREFISITFRSSAKKLQQMKQVLRETRDHLNKTLSDEEGTEVFQVCMALFPHTDLKG